MSNVFTLDAMRDAIVNRYAPTVIDLGDGESVELKSMLKLRSKDRDAVVAAIGDVNALEYDDEDEESIIEWSEAVVEICSKVFRLIASSPKRLINALDHEDPEVKASLFTQVLTTWVGKSQLGEAESSLSS